MILCDVQKLLTNDMAFVRFQLLASDPDGFILSLVSLQKELRRLSHLASNFGTKNQANK
jgi:hypothetical protein